MKNFLCRILIFTVLFIAVNILVGLSLEKLFTTHPVIKYSWIYGQKNQEYDFAFSGSSRCLFMADVPILEERIDASGINLGIDGSGMADTYITLYNFLSENGVRKLFLQIDAFSLSSAESFSDPFKEYAHIRYLRDKNVSNIYTQYHKPKLIWKIFPWSRFVEFNTIYKIPNLYVAIITGNNFFQKNKGYIPLNKEDFAERKVKHIKNKKLNEYDRYYFEKIAALCSLHQTDLILYTAPFLNYNTYYQSDTINQYIEHYADSMKIPYYNFSDTSCLDTKRYYEDISHLNKKGTRVFSEKYLTPLLIKHLYNN